MIDISRIAFGAAAIWAVIALTTFYLGELMVAGISFLLVSFSLFVWETRKKSAK